MAVRSEVVDRAELVAWYRRNRERSQKLFALLTDDAYYAQPIGLRHPIVFYEGHLPAFSFITLVKRGLGGSPIDERLERLFARGIDPDEPVTATSPGGSSWPSRDTVRGFAAEADRRVVEALEHEDLDRPGHPLLNRGEAAFAILEHEAMHQETLLYMWHRLPFEQKHRPPGYQPATAGETPRQEWIDVPGGRATLGVDREAVTFAWDNERPALAATVDAFSIDRHNVTNAAFLEFVRAGGYEAEQWWRPDDWAWICADRIRHPLFWESDGRDWLWRGCRSGAADGLALCLVSQAEASLRAGTARRLATERVSAGARSDAPMNWAAPVTRRRAVPRCV